MSGVRPNRLASLNKSRNETKTENREPRTKTENRELIMPTSYSSTVPLSTAPEAHLSPPDSCAVNIVFLQAASTQSPQRHARNPLRSPPYTQHPKPSSPSPPDAPPEFLEYPPGNPIESH